MPAYMKLGDVKGESTDAGHKEWILLESMSAPIHRTIPQGAKDMERSRGETVLGDVVVVRKLDKSSVKLAESCANGTFFPEVQIDFCTMVRDKNEPYLIYKLKNVIVSSHAFHGTASGDPVPTEEVTLGYDEIEWTYIVVDPKTGDKKGNVPGKFRPS